MHIALAGNNQFEYLQLILLGWVRNLEMFIIAPIFNSPLIDALKRIPPLAKYIKKSIKEYRGYVGDDTGLWYKVEEEALDLTVELYNKHLKIGNKTVSYYNKLFNANKFEGYVKREISNHVYILLKHLHIVRLSSLKQNYVLLSRTPINDFAVRYLETEYGVKYKIRWVTPLWGPFSLFMYYMWIPKEVIKRGVVFNRARKDYKISAEAAWGFHSKTLRNDFMIDNSRFKTRDILMLELDDKDPYRAGVFKEAKDRNFDTTSIPKLKININKNIFDLLFFYCLSPIKTYFQLLLCRQTYFFHYMAFFYKKCFVIEILMNLYNIKCNISIAMTDDIAATMILNKYGTKNVIFHWSDQTACRSYCNAFMAHNIYFTWGDLHLAHHSGTHLVDKRVNVGCIFKKGYNAALKKRREIAAKVVNVNRQNKVVAFFDTSFDNSFHFTERFFLEFREMVKEFSKQNQNIHVLLKPKYAEHLVVSSLNDNLVRYRKMRKELFACDNFHYLNPLKWEVEDAIAISDVCISMGITSPSTIALICGKNGLYFDRSGNTYAPFIKKYKNMIAFDDKCFLFKQIDNILDGKFHCRDVIGEREIRQYDAFSDDNALERLKENLYRLTF